MMHGHVAIKFAGTDADEGNAVAVARIHVRLNLENEAGVFEHFQFLDGFMKSLLVEPAANFRVVNAADGNRRAIFAADGAVEQMKLFHLPVINALKINAVADRPVHRKRADAEHALQFVEQLQRIFHRPVALVHERENRHATLPADLEQLSRLRFDAFRGINHHHHRIHGGQHAISVLGKILVAGRVEQVDAIAVVVELAVTEPANCTAPP